MIFVDLETFSCTNLREAGVYRYCADPTFEILMAAYATELHGPVEVAIGEEEIREIPGLLLPGVGGMHVAHNAQFERICFSTMVGMPVGTYLPAHVWRDTNAIAGQLGYPKKLEKLAAALRVPGKDPAGTTLINWFCKPDRFGRRRVPADHPEKWAAFVEYCRQDVVTLMNVDAAMGCAWPNENEHRIWLADQAINDRGFRIDLDMAHQAQAAVEENHMVQELEITQLTGVANPGSQPQLLKWLKDSGIKIGNLQAEVVEEVLTTELTRKQRRVLELRQELAGTASKKYMAALQNVSEDCRVRGGFSFYGAHTGRWSGRGFQPHNMVRASFYDEEGDYDEAAQDAAILDLALDAGGDATTLRKLVRPLLVVDGVVVDYAAIEARVIAWLASEEWALEAFEAGRDIYVETAERMGGLTRAQGKVAVLALGYNGGIGSLAAMGAQGDDDELQMMVDTWRSANPHIVRMWKIVQSRFGAGGPIGKHLTVERDGTSRHIRLPSGRAISYHKVAWEKYVVLDKKTNRRVQKEGWRFIDPKRGIRVGTYGGRLSENITQGVARDILAEALVRLEDAGYRTVAHVHDEVVVENTTDLGGVIKIMCEQPSWAEGLPIDGEGFFTRRYRKA